jgi:hypothetical protein
MGRYVVGIAEAVNGKGTARAEFRGSSDLVTVKYWVSKQRSQWI